MRRSQLAVSLVFAALVAASGTYRYQTDTGVAQAEGESVCAELPTLLAAVDHTLATWPPETAVVPADVKASLLYFASLARTDNDWCAAGNTGAQPELLAKTQRWHFGNASVALINYQNAARGAASLPPSSAAIPTPSPAAAGTRADPVPLRTPAEFAGGWTVNVLSVTPNANAVVHTANPYNPPPRDGYQFFIARIRATNNQSDPQRFEGNYRLRAVGATGKVYSTFRDSCGIIPDKLPDPLVSRGGSIAGNVCWAIASGDATALQVYDDPLLNGGHRTAYLSLVP